MHIEHVCSDIKHTVYIDIDIYIHTLYVTTHMLCLHYPLNTGNTPSSRMSRTPVSRACLFFPGALLRDTSAQSILLTLLPSQCAASFTHEVLMFLN